MPLPIVRLASRATSHASSGSVGGSRGRAASRTAARVDQVGMPAGELQQRLVRHAAVAVGAAEAPRPRAGVAALERELEVLLERRRRRRGAPAAPAAARRRETRRSAPGATRRGRTAAGRRGRRRARDASYRDTCGPAADRGRAPDPPTPTGCGHARSRAWTPRALCACTTSLSRVTRPAITSKGSGDATCRLTSASHSSITKSGSFMNS